jgi:hypothetical protein
LNAPIRVDPAVLDKAAFPTGGEERARQAPEIVAETKESWRAHARPCAAEQPEEE